ncbi:MAG TPA: membrane protein insertion efficiency factor YidD [Kiritimatiellia bacterium]|nr:membrane protein insertion efficiency factor YidD [Kiritimatiellia bacterium]
MPGIFFFAMALGAAAGSATLDLAVDLFAEGSWAAAHVEGLRVQAEVSGPGANRAQSLAAVSSLRLDAGRESAKDVLANLWRAGSADLETRCMAAYEYGLADWADGGTNAAAALEFAYLETRDTPLFWRAGCSLYFYLKADKPLRESRPATWRSLQSCRDAWPLAVWQECRPRKPRGPSVASLPGRWIVAFYRAQIGPAIGSRCDLQPSCSEYFLQASRAHGWLGVPIMADRFVREPSVVSAREKPVAMPDGRVRFADPVSDHDRWLKGKP